MSQPKNTRFWPPQGLLHYLAPIIRLHYLAPTGLAKTHIKNAKIMQKKCVLVHYLAQKIMKKSPFIYPWLRVYPSPGPNKWTWDQKVGVSGPIFGPLFGPLFFRFPRPNFRIPGAVFRVLRILRGPFWALLRRLSGALPRGLFRVVLRGPFAALPPIKNHAY